MADSSYILFNKSPLQLRNLGARGGRAYGRNLRARRALTPTPPPAAPLPAAPRQTAAEAVAVLDAQFPWLRCAEKRLGARLRPGLASGVAKSVHGSVVHGHGDEIQIWTRRY